MGSSDSGRSRTPMEAEDHLAVAEHHLARHVRASPDQADWDELVTFGFYCVEAAVLAAAVFAGWRVRSSHVAKVEASKRLAQEHGLPAVDDLLVTLNDSRKAVAYGDVSAPALETAEIVRRIEHYVRAVRHFLGREA